MHDFYTFSLNLHLISFRYNVFPKNNIWARNTLLGPAKQPANHFEFSCRVTMPEGAQAVGYGMVETIPVWRHLF